VTLRARVDGDAVVLEVHDVGPGRAPELQAKVFEKFWTSGGGGAGLGLAIARQVARAHGSELTLESRPGDTTFSLRLPRWTSTTTDEGLDAAGGGALAAVPRRAGVGAAVPGRDGAGRRGGGARRRSTPTACC
jgi:hypothetical protein